MVLTKRHRNILRSHKFPKPRRNFRSPNGFLEYEYLQCLKALVLLDESGKVDDLKNTIRGVDSLKIDPYFLSEGLAELLIRTDLPEKVYSSPDISPVLEIVLPHGFLVDEGQSVSLMYIVDIPLHFEMSSMEVPDLTGLPGMGLRDLIYVVYGVNEFGSVYQDRIFTDTCLLQPFCEDHESNYSNVYTSLRSLALNLLLLLKEYPEYVTVESGIKGKSGFGSISCKDRKTAPRVIGENFNIRPVRKVFKGEQESVNGRFRIPHMRRGHWRRQRHGVNRSSVKQVWIRPMLINCDID